MMLSFKTVSKNSGYALLFALVAIALLLLFGLMISRVSYQELEMSGVALESQRALNASNGGAECVMFWDRRSQSIFGVENNIDCFVGVSSPVVEVEPNVYQFKLSYTGDSCAIVTVDKRTETETVIESRGYNICPSGDDYNSRRVERAVRVSYESSYAQIYLADISLVLDVSGSMGTEEAGGKTRMTLMKEAIATFLQEVDSFNLGDEIMIGLTEFSSNAKVISEISADIQAIIQDVNNMNAGGYTNIPGGLMIGSDIITGNPDNLLANSGQPIVGGRGLPHGQKFVILVTDGIANKTSYNSGIERGMDLLGSNLTDVSGSESQASAIATDMKDDENIIVITFGVGNPLTINNEWLRNDVASDEDDWERCGEFDEGKCHFQVDNFEEFREVFNLSTIFGVNPIFWVPI